MKLGKFIEFTSTEKSKDGRKSVFSLPVSEIKKIESILGGECVYLKVNGIRVEGSYQHLKELLAGKDLEKSVFTDQFKTFG